MKSQKGQVVTVLTLIAMGLMTIGIGLGTWAVKSPRSPFYSRAEPGCASFEVEPGYSWDNPEYKRSYEIRARFCNISNKGRFNSSGWFKSYDKDYIWSATGGWGLPGSLDPGECQNVTLTINMQDSWKGSPQAKATFVANADAFCIGTSCTGCSALFYQTLTFGTNAAPTPTPTVTPGGPTPTPTTTPTPTVTPAGPTPTPPTTPTPTPTATPTPRPRVCCCQINTNCTTNCQWIQENACIPDLLFERCTDDACPTPTPTSTPTPTVTPAPTGCSYDSDAYICVDKNNNNSCDTDELITSPGFSARYTLANGESGVNVFNNGAILYHTDNLDRSKIGTASVTLNMPSGWEIVSPFCNDAPSKPQSCLGTEGLNTIKFKVDCGVDHDYGWILKPPPCEVKVNEFEPFFPAHYCSSDGTAQWAAGCSYPPESTWYGKEVQTCGYSSRGSWDKCADFGSIGLQAKCTRGARLDFYKNGGKDNGSKDEGGARSESYTCQGDEWVGTNNFGVGIDYLQWTTFKAEAYDPNNPSCRDSKEFTIRGCQCGEWGQRPTPTATPTPRAMPTPTPTRLTPTPTRLTPTPTRLTPTPTMPTATPRARPTPTATPTLPAGCRCSGATINTPGICTSACGSMAGVACFGNDDCYPRTTATSAAVVDQACNSDGMVNALDYRVVIQNYGESGRGDVNGDGVVNGIDISLLLKFIGQKVE